MKANFNKSFEALYAIGMKMADECIGQKEMINRFEKLNEECDELYEAFSELGNFEKETDLIKVNGIDHAGHVQNLKSELSDVFFVLLHIAHKYNITPFQMLHMASSKMLARMNDVNYKAKN